MPGSWVRVPPLLLRDELAVPDNIRRGGVRIIHNRERPCLARGGLRQINTDGVGVINREACDLDSPWLGTVENRDHDQRGIARRVALDHSVLRSVAVEVVDPREERLKSTAALRRRLAHVRSK